MNATQLAIEYGDLMFRLGAGTWTYEERTELAKECDAKLVELRALGGAGCRLSRLP